LIHAISVPGFWRSHTVANLESSMPLGSARISVAPRWVTARLMKLEITGWFSVVLVPVMRKHFDSSISAIEFVMAPEPNAVARPATVELCQSRAQ